MSDPQWLPLLVWGERRPKTQLDARWAQTDQDHFYFHSPSLFAAPARLLGRAGADGGVAIERFELEGFEPLGAVDTSWEVQRRWELFKREQDALAQRDELGESSVRAPSRAPKSL